MPNPTRAHDTFPHAIFSLNLRKWRRPACKLSRNLPVGGQLLPPPRSVDLILSSYLRHDPSTRVMHALIVVIMPGRNVAWTMYGIHFHLVEVHRYLLDRLEPFNISAQVMHVPYRGLHVGSINIHRCEICRSYLIFMKLWHRSIAIFKQKIWSPPYDVWRLCSPVASFE